MKTSPLSRSGLRKVLSRIGSQTFLEPVSLLVLVVPLMFVTSVATAETSTVDQFLSWLLANVVALAGLAIPIVGFRYLWLRKFPSLVFPLPVAILIAAGIGWLKAFLTARAAVFLSGQDFLELNLGARLWGGVLSGIVALISASAILLLLQEFQAERMLLLTARTMASAPLVTAAESKKLTQLSKGLDEILKAVMQNQRSAPKMEATLLRDLVDKYVRPLSSSLFTVAERNYQSFAAKELLRTALRGSPPALALALNFLISTPRNIDWLGPSTGIQVTILVSATIYLSVRLLGAVTSRLAVNGPVIFVLISTSTTLASVLFWVAVLEPNKVVDPSIILTLIVWSAQSGIVFGMAKVALTSAAKNRREVSELVQLCDPDAALALLRRNRKLMANQMHGEVQSRLMNLVLTSESGAELEAKVVLAELEAIQHLIENVKQERKSLKDSLAQLVSTWSGFAELDIDLRGAKIAKEKEDLVFALIEEGVSNAIRHGLADRVSVGLEPGQLLVIADNGMGPISGKPGLGSKLFDAGSENWSLTALDDGGSRLEAKLRLD